MYAWFNTNLTSASSTCILYYQPGDQPKLNLLNDGATAWQAATLGAATTLQNSQCSVNVATATAVPSSLATPLTLTLPMTFKPAYVGAKNVYMYDSDVSRVQQWLATGRHLDRARRVPACRRRFR